MFNREPIAVPQRRNEQANTYYKPFIRKEDSVSPARYLKKGLERRKRSLRGEPYICKED